ncbi:hypothetical protein [Benzoatithermus flavus]|uniref:Uncharacterized protein n=1 Tax=Benzoatithermus flavus TaxID=3108223 RepID=A0ABU8XQG5_9PROT
MRALSGEFHVLKPEGGFYGGPASIKDFKDLEERRALIDKMVEGGAKSWDWYERARAGIREVTGGDPAKMDLMAAENGLWSPLADPDPNLGFALRAHNNYEVGNPLFSVRDTTKARIYNEARDAGKGGLQIRLGRKTLPYRQAINPNEPFPVTGVNDTREATVQGYSREEIEKGLHDAEHRFMDAEMMLRVDRLNKKAVGGKTDWNAQSAQASPWVYQKALDLLAKGRAKTLEEALAIAHESPTEHFPKYTAYSTYELVPGAGTGHMDELVNQPYDVRAAFSNDPRLSWNSPTGNDILYNALWMYNRNSIPMTGADTAPGGALEVNPGRSTRPLVSFEPNTLSSPDIAKGEKLEPNPAADPGKVIDQASRTMMNTAEALRAYMDMQNAGAWHKPVVGNKAKYSEGITIATPEPLTEEQMHQLQEIVRKYNIPGAADTGEGVTLFGGAKELGTPNKPGPLAEDLKRPFPGAQASRAHVQGDYIDYSAVSGKEFAGQGKRTELLSSYLQNPKLLQKLDNDPAVRQAAANRIEVAKEMQAKGYSIRDDHIRALEYLRDGGPSLLLQKWKEGAVLPAVALAVMQGLGGFASQNEAGSGS